MRCRDDHGEGFHFFSQCASHAQTTEKRAETTSKALIVTSCRSPLFLGSSPHSLVKDTTSTASIALNVRLLVSIDPCRVVLSAHDSWQDTKTQAPKACHDDKKEQLIELWMNYVCMGKQEGRPRNCLLCRIAKRQETSEVVVVGRSCLYWRWYYATQEVRSFGVSLFLLASTEESTSDSRITQSLMMAGIFQSFLDRFLELPHIIWTFRDNVRRIFFGEQP